MPNSPTIVSAALSDKELQDSINKMVANFDKGLQDMLDHSNKYVEKIQESLQKIGSTNFGAKGSNDGGVAKQTKAQNADTDAIEKNIAARDKQIKKNQEAATSFDNFAKAQQVAIRSASPSGIRNAEELQTMNIQLDLLRERLREARQQYSSFVALAAHATTTGDKGLFQYATDGVHRYEQEVRSLIPQIRTLQSGIQQMGDVIAPQGHTIQNYVNSLQKANPELAALNAQYKSGTSLLQDQSTSYASATQSAQRYTEEIRKQAAAIRATKEWQDKGHVVVGDVNYYDKERANVSKRDKQLLLSLEEQIVQAQQKEAQEALVAAEAKRQQAQASKEAAQADSKTKTLYNYDYTKSVARAGQIGTTNSQEVNYLKTQIADLLGIQEREVQMVNVQKATYGELSSYIKQLQTAYKNLGNDIAGRHGKDIADELQRAQRELQKYQAQMSRPTSLKAAMGLSEKTLDDIAYKMRQLASYRSGLNVNTQRNEISQVNAEYDRLRKKMDEVIGKNQQMIASNTALGRSWTYMKNRLAFYFTVGSSTAFVKNLIEVRSQYEMNERALGILIDSAERGSKIFQELSQMALVSPYTLIELSTAAKQLTAYDVAAKDVVDTTRRLADMAAAVGIPIERLTYALGQIKAYGYLNARDARMFSNAGIPLVKQLSEYYTELEGRLVSTADVYDRIKKKSIDYSDVMSVINKMTDEGGKFFDFQAKMADTLKVQLANLTLAWNNMLNDIGKSQQGILTAGIGGLKQLFLHWKELNKVLNDAAIIFGLVYTAHMLLTVAYGKGSSQILLQAARTRTLTTEQVNQLLTTNNLTKAQLKFMLSLTKTNQEAVKQAATLGILNKKELASVTSAGKLKTAWLGVGAAFSTVGKAIQALVASVAAAAPALLALTAVAAIVDLIQTVNDRNEAIKSLNESIVKNAEESAKSIKETLSSLNDIYENAGVKDATGLKVEEQEKAWEMLREQIELTSAASNKFIQTLLQEDKMGERVNKGKELLEHIQRVHEIMSTWHDDAIVVTDDFKILGIGADGLSEDLNDFQKYLNKAGGNIEELDEYSKGLGGTWRQILSYVYDFSDILSFTGAGTASPIGWLKNIADATGLDFLSPDKAKLVDSYKEVMDEIEPLSKSIQKQILQDNITNLDEIKELVSKTINSIATERQWSDEKTLYARLLLEKQWGESQNAIFKNAVADNQTAWDAWMKYLTSRHKTEFSKMGAETISQEQWTQDGRKKLYEETFQKFKEYNSLAASMIEDSVNNLNQLQVHIKVFYDEQNTPSWIEQDFKKRVPTSNLNVKQYKTVTDLIAGEQKALKDANEEIQRLRAAGVSELDKHFLDTKERARQAVEALDAYNAEHEKVTKGGRGGSKKDILGEALSKEVQLITDIRKRYEEYKKIGVAAQEALKAATDEYGVSLKNVKNTLSKFGISGLEGVDVANMEMRDLVKKFEEMKTKASLKGNVKGVEALEKAIAALNVEITKLDYKKIADGLNNELGKLKDEYELAVELDANPELGGMFLDMFGIDPSDFSHNIDDYMFKVQSAFEKARRELGYGVTIDVFKANDEEWKKWGEWVGLSGEALDNFKARFVSAQGVAKKWAQDTIKATQDLEYKLGDLAKKVEIEEAKLAVLEDNAANETNAAQKRLLELRIQQQKEAIEKLKMESVKLLPFYEDLFGDMYNVSVGRLKEIAKAAKEVMSPRQGDSGVGYTQRTDDKGKVVYDIFAKDKQGNIKKTTVSLEEYIKINKQIDSVQQKIAESSPWEKIKDSFSKKEGGGLKNFASGMEAIGGELQKVANITKEIGGFAEALGADENTVEIINDIAASIGGVATAAQGIGQIASGDYIGGAASVLSGAFSAISSWFDNADKKILQQIKDSETAVKRLELAYIDLEHAVNEAYGMATIGANMAAKANKELQLVELKRQLALERSRDSKNRDEDKIIDLQKQIKELEYDIADTVDSIVNDLLGISSVGDAMESLMDGFIEALRNGEDAMAVFDESIDEMIANMVKKMFVTKILQPWFEEQWNKIQNQINERAGKLPEELAKAQSKVSEAKMADLDDNDSLVGALRALGMDDEQIHLLNWYNEFGQNDLGFGRNARLRAAYEKMLKEAEQKEAELQKELTTATMPTTDDIRQYAELLRSGKPIMEENMQEVANFLRELGLMKDDANKNLSALQQGIQGITEDTAGALEAYMNGVSQQVYLHSDLLTQIRDAVVGFDMDVQTATMGEILLQLRSSYEVQMAIHGILEGVLTPSGRSFSVELVS